MEARRCKATTAEALTKRTVLSILAFFAGVGVVGELQSIPAEF